MMRNWLANKRMPFWRWSVAFFVAMGAAVVATFFVSGRSFLAEWSLMGAQLFAVAVFSLPVGMLISSLSKGCIVCRDDVCVNENVEAGE